MPRSPDQVRWDFVQDWLRKAEADLTASEVLLRAQLDDYFTAAFHAQQAAEKFLKAFLVRHQIAFPKTHDIGQLLTLITRIDQTLQHELADAEMLTPFGVEFRYPGEEIADLQMATQALQQARHVKDTVLSRLKSYLDAGRPAC